MSDTLPLRPPGAAQRPWYEHRWPWFLMLGPFLIVLAGCFTGYLAFTRQDALVVGDYYKQGKAINQDLRRDRAASALALATALHYDAAHATLVGKISSYQRAYNVPLLLHLAHATQPEKDIKLVVQTDAEGNFSAPLPAFERTRWQVLVENDQRDWRLAGTWIWPAQQAIELHADAALKPAE
ncbi:FixH family protein [Janthinobacterium fluminis]|uniref:FixH family protein n=1 Tax=Janthinobacterium fluminis TaxID=2987524 RepID=A0ABT5K0E9_9BURK|nr:FixH family protein [Janthinobacterium fluminis]MDC8757888.1 FixH family protein [Janthinobacterium fluminis]